MSHSQMRTEPAFPAGELDHPGARDLLATQSLLRLAYTGPDGFPRVIPIGFHWTGEHIIVCTVPSSPKVRALAARPHVALTIDTDQGTASRCGPPTSTCCPAPARSPLLKLVQENQAR